MSTTLSHNNSVQSQKIKAYYELTKPRLSFLVVFSSGFGYMLASPVAENVVSFVLFLLGGFLVSASSVTINQVVEKRFDAIMQRTKNRPLPAGQLSKEEAIVFSFISGIAGLSIIYFFTTPLAALLSFSSLKEAHRH